jgi:hypothetical protein
MFEELIRLYELHNHFISDIESIYIRFYSNVIKELLASQLNIEKHKSSIINIIRKHLSVKHFEGDDVFKEHILKVIEEEMTTDRLVTLSKKITNFVIWHKANMATKRIFGGLKECSATYDIDYQESRISDINDQLLSFKKEIDLIQAKIGNNQTLEKIDFTDKEDISNAFDIYKSRKVSHIMKTGLQGLNQLCGPRGGFALGESVIFCALPHNFKSTMLMSIAKWIVKYSIPPKTDKKPMILFITLENEAYENMMIWFESIYYDLHGCKPTDMTDEDIINCIHDYFSSKDYVLVIERYLPSTFGFEELVTLIEKYENSGFYIYGVFIDYLQHMKKSSGLNSRVGNHLLIQELFNRVCNFFKAKGTTMFSAHQLNRKAAEIVSSGLPDPVKRFSEDHLAFSMDVAREPDMIVYMHITKNDEGVPFLTLKWGKHRYVHDTPEAHKYVAYELTDNGLIDDVEADFGGTRNIYSKKGGGDKIDFGEAIVV